MKRWLWRIFSCVLVLCILSGTAQASAAEKPMCFWVASDTHYYAASDLGEMNDRYTEHLIDRDLFSYVSTQGQMQYESRAIMQRFLDDFVRSDAQYLLIPGDLTGGKRQSHLEFAAMLRRAQRQSGKRIFVINGNHDCVRESDGQKISMPEFCELYRDFGYSQALRRHETSASYVVNLDSRTRLLAIDSCIYGEDEGELNRSVCAFIRREMQSAKEDGVSLIAMMHHSILPHYVLQPMIPKADAHAAMLADGGVQLVLTGHIHANDITARKTVRGSMLYDVQTGSLITTPNAYRCVRIQNGEINMTSGYVTQIDTRLLPQGFSEAQKSLMQKDLPAYARAYLTAGVCKFLNRNIGSANRVGRLLKLKEGSESYAALDKLMHRLGDAVGLDYYASSGKPSIESVLAPFGISVPNSQYQKPYEAAANVMYGFFHGDESAVSSPQDVTLVRLGIEGAVVYALETALTHGEQDKLVAALAHTARNTPKARITVAGKLADALLGAIAGGFCDDYSVPKDIALRIALNGSNEQASVLLPFERLIRLPERFCRRLLNDM